MKNYTIREIESMKEADAAALALETLSIKEHTVYLVDFGGAFGYSCLVFKNGHHIHYANDYQLHHNHQSGGKEALRSVYLNKMQSILFTPEEIAAPLADYQEYDRKEYYLRNYYGMQEDYISSFYIKGTEQEKKERAEKVAGMVYDPVSFAYYDNADFVKEHIALFLKLEAVKDAMGDNFNYWKGAFRHEMANHEYQYNWQADYDTLSAFGCIQYHGDDEDEVEQYFNELHFTDTQRKAYRAARQEYLRDCEF